MKAKAMTITISFKSSNESEIELYNFLSKHSCMSGYVKDILKKEMEKENKENAKSSFAISNLNSSLFSIFFILLFHFFL